METYQLHRGKARTEDGLQLWCQIDFRNEHQCLPRLSQQQRNQTQVYLGFPAAGNPMQQPRVERIYFWSNHIDGILLRGGKDGHRR